MKFEDLTPDETKIFDELNLFTTWLYSKKKGLDIVINPAKTDDLIMDYLRERNDFLVTMRHEYTALFSDLRFINS